MPTPAGVGILPVNLDEQTRDVVVQVVREVAPKMEVLEEQQACKTPETMRDYTEQTVTSDTSRSVKTKLSSSVDSSGSISWLDNFTSLEFSRDRRTGEGNDRSTSIESKSLFQSESLLKSDEVSPSTPNDLSGFAKVLDEFGTPPNADFEWQLVATMPGSCPQFSLSQMIIVFPTEGTSGSSGVFRLGSVLQNRTAQCPRDPPKETAVPQERALTTREQVSYRRPVGEVCSLVGKHNSDLKEDGLDPYISSSINNPIVHTIPTSLKGTVHARCLLQDRCACHDS